MPTEQRDGPKAGRERQAVVFCFAHQDDEFAALSIIETACTTGTPVYCLYFTTGVPQGQSSVQRNQESVRALTRLGVLPENIFFLGDLLGISDGQLPHCVSKAYGHWLSQAQQWRSGQQIYVPAWEGGHSDHDALHAIVVSWAATHAELTSVSQVPLYNASGLPAPWFRVQHPLPENGLVRASPVNPKRRAAYLWLVLKGYPSQWKSWLGLWPFYAWRMLRQPRQTSQPVSLRRLFERPHAGELYYERRGFGTWEQLQLAVKTLTETTASAH